MTKTQKPKTIKTTWRMWTYDVWGNAKDGYDVNDRYSHGLIELRLKVIRNNVGTPLEFVSAYPTEYQLKKIFGVRCELDIDGDDREIRVDRASDSYPIGELNCESHESLSPIKERVS